MDSSEQTSFLTFLFTAPQTSGFPLESLRSQPVILSVYHMELSAIVVKQNVTKDLRVQIP